MWWLYTQAAVCAGERAAHPVPDCPHLRRGELAPAQLARFSHHLGGTQVCEIANFLVYFYVIRLRKYFSRINAVDPKGLSLILSSKPGPKVAP